MLETITIIIGSILMLLGLAGSVLPILPGPPLSFVGLFLLALIKHFSPPLTPTLVIILAVVTVLVIMMDYVLPLVGAKKYGASKWGVWGSVLGMVRDIFFTPGDALRGFSWSGCRGVVGRESTRVKPNRSRMLQQLAAPTPT